jgi:hypothetical protein
MNLKGSPTLIRKLIQQAGTSDRAGRLSSILRKAVQTAGAGSETKRITQAKRTIADTGKAGTGISKKQGFMWNIAHTGNMEAEALRSAGYVKYFQNMAGSTAYTGVVREVVLKIAKVVAALYEMKAGARFNRSVTDTVKNNSVMGGMVMFFRVLFGHAGNGDSTGSFITRMRLIQDTEAASDEMGDTADYLRGLFEEAGNIAETTHRGEYYRKQQDTAYSETVSLRQLFVFIRLLTGAYIRDYIIGWFLKSKEEMVIKSPVCRDITIESTLH